MIVVIDNYDSFTYNLVQYLGELGETVEVYRNDKTTIAAVAAVEPEAIVVSPGPCSPREAGISVELIRELGPRIPTLGVCLGHQCIGAAFGGTVVRAPEIMHGKTSLIYHDGEGVFAGVPNPFEAIRYHSLIVERGSLPPELNPTAQTSNGLIMGLRHRTYPIEGVQFHPESIKTDVGKDLLRNFLVMARRGVGKAEQAREAAVVA
ncbi:MAG: aminodeoxychorismate/anthranilate synthase component II [Chloroflexi bacterium]|nr:aminodeoxychorismate/anthranilate synthase component II [Chloroflexota bacterium]